MCRCRAGDHTRQHASAKDPDRGRVPETGTEGLRRVYEESTVQADLLSLVGQPYSLCSEIYS